MLAASADGSAEAVAFYVAFDVALRSVFRYVGFESFQRCDMVQEMPVTLARLSLCSAPEGVSG